MKKFALIVFSAIISFSALSALTARADDELDTPVSDPIIEEYQYTTTASSNIYVSGNTANCISSCVGITGVYKISGIQYLEKKSGFLWIPIENWTGSDNDNTLDMNNSKSGLSSGTYHTKTSFVVYYGNTSEMITVTGYSRTI